MFNQYKTKAEETMKVCMCCGKVTSSTTAGQTPYYCMAMNKYVDMFHSCAWFVPKKGYSNAD